MFEIEIYKSILFLHRCRRLPPVPSLPFHASFGRHAAVIFTFAGPLQAAGPPPSARMVNHHYICCQIRWMGICICEYVVPYVWERGGSQEESNKIFQTTGPPLLLPPPSLHICHFHPLFFPLSLFAALFWPISVVPPLSVTADLGECDPADGELRWPRRCHPRWWGGGSFGMRGGRGGKRPSMDASWRSGNFEGTANRGSAAVWPRVGANQIRWKPASRESPDSRPPSPL